MRIFSGFLFFIFLLGGSFSFAQNVVSQPKLVIINSNSKKVFSLYRSFSISELNFIDANINRQIEEKDSCAITFYIKNNGTVPLQEVKVSLSDSTFTKGISFDTIQVIKQINIEDSVLVTFPIYAAEGINDGVTKFSVSARDISNDSIRKAGISILTKETLYPPVFTWVSPDSILKKIEFPVFEIKGIISTRTRLTALNVIVNGQPLSEKISFTILPTENLNEYRIAGSLNLNEGYNEIRIEAQNEKGLSCVSDPRILNYFVQKIDESYSEKRLALVVGNSDYKNANTLANPINDARAISEALKEVEFTVMTYLDADLKTLENAIEEFGEKLEDYTVGLFYFAGHGVQVKGANYLIPVDAKMKVEQDVKYDCVDAGQILGKMEAAGTTTNIVILDACRNNPFERSWAGRSVTQGNGLAMMDAPSGSIVAYATAPGKTASDGTGKNGLYTEAILKYIAEPGLSILDFFTYVNSSVAKKSNKGQIPWYSSSLMGKFYFKLK